MPLIKSGSRDAMSKNIKAEMDAGKPQKQSIAIAYAMKKRAGSPKKKMMAEGGVADDDIDREMVKGRKLEHGSEIDAADGMPTMDNASDEREMEMRHGASDMHDPEINFHEEGMGGIDDEKRMRSQQMMKMARGGEIDARDEHMSGIDDEDKIRDMDMVKGKPMSHMAEKSAKDYGMVGEDSRDAMEMEMIKMAMGGIADRIRRKKMMAEGGRIDGGVDLQDNNGDTHLNKEDQLSYEAARKKTYFDDSQMKDEPMDSNEHGDDIDSDAFDMISKIRSKMRSKRS